MITAALMSSVVVRAASLFSRSSNNEVSVLNSGINGVVTFAYNFYQLLRLLAILI
jgi:hypothetical protein